jgi:hypothetical protein
MSDRHLRLQQRPVHLAWMLLNDAYRSVQVLSTSSEVLACACLYCGMQFAVAAGKNEERVEEKWWQMFDVMDNDLQAACRWLLQIWEQDCGLL